jgi:hypothetical protein
MMESFVGPLGTHRNYLTHIALPNCFAYLQLVQGNQEEGNVSISAKYAELRHFLNAIESLNNVLEYYFYENETQLSQPLQDFKKSMFITHPELGALADLANAYKHCVRERKGIKRTDVPSAKDMQLPKLRIAIDLSQRPKVKVDVDYHFEAPTPEHREVFDKALKFWFEYHNDRVTLVPSAPATP